MPFPNGGCTRRALGPWTGSLGCEEPEALAGEEMGRNKAPNLALEELMGHMASHLTRT